MESGNINEFRLRDYVQVFEKTLNYMAGAIVAAMIAGICHIVSDPNMHLTIDTMFRMIQDLHKNPQEFFLPYNIRIIYSAILFLLLPERQYRVERMQWEKR